MHVVRVREGDNLDIINKYPDSTKRCSLEEANLI